MKILAKRLSKVLPLFMSENQIAFLNGQRISNKVGLTSEFLTGSEENQYREELASWLIIVKLLILSVGMQSTTFLGK